MRILSTCKLCVDYAGLGNEQTVTVGGFTISRSLIRFFFILGQLSFVAMETLVLINSWSTGLHAILFPLHLILLFSMKACVYIILVTKTETIAELITTMQNVIDKRS